MIRGVSEETTTGVMCLYQLQQQRAALPAINVNDSVTKSKFDNKYGTRESLVDAIRRGTDVMLAGKVAIVCGYGDVGRARRSAGGAGARVLVTEVDPICGPAGGDGRLRGGDARGCRVSRRHRVTATGNKDVVTVDHAPDARHGDRVQHRPLRQRNPGGGVWQLQWTNVKPQVDLIELPSGKRIVLLSEGRLVNLGNATGHPSFVMSASFSNQTLAQIELWTNGDKLEHKVHVLPKHLDEKVAELHLAKLGAKLTTLSKAQADYIGVKPQGPFKPEHYRY